MGLAGKTIVVTGASGNLGRAVCARLVEGGARLLPFVHKKRSPEERAVELADERSVEAGFEGVSGLWAAVNCAGGWKGGVPVKDTPVEVFETMIDSNLRSAFLINRAALGILRTPENERAMPGANRERWVKLDEVAEAIAFLCDPRSTAVNGAVIALP